MPSPSPTFRFSFFLLLRFLRSSSSSFILRRLVRRSSRCSWPQIHSVLRDLRPLPAAFLSLDPVCLGILDGPSADALPSAAKHLCDPANQSAGRRWQASAI